MRSSSLAPIFIASVMALGLTEATADVRIGNVVVPGNNVQITGPISVRNGVVSNPQALPSGSYYVDPRTGARTPVNPAVPQVPQYPAYSTYQTPRSFQVDEPLQVQSFPKRTQENVTEYPRYMAFRSKGREMYCLPTLLFASVGEAVDDYCPNLQSGTRYSRVQHDFVEVVELNAKTTAFCRKGKGGTVKANKKFTVSDTVPEEGIDRTDCLFASWGTGPVPTVR